MGTFRNCKAGQVALVAPGGAHPKSYREIQVLTLCVQLVRVHHRANNTPIHKQGHRCPKGKVFFRTPGGLHILQLGARSTRWRPTGNTGSPTTALKSTPHQRNESSAQPVVILERLGEAVG